MSAASSNSPEAKELNLVGKVELRIALADSDAKLEAILKTYLPPLLLKLASEHVLSVLQHVSTRITPPTIKLPLAALLTQFKDAAATPLIRHFGLLFIQQGIGRVPPRDRIEILPTLIHGIHSDTLRSQTHGAGLFNLLFRLLPHFSLPPRGSKEDGQLREKLHLQDASEDMGFIAAYFGKLILLTVNRVAAAGNDPSTVTCAGLTPQEYSFLTLSGKKGVWDPTHESGLSLMEIKVAACKFLSSGAFTNEERYLPALFASADANSNIADLGDEMLKRASPGISLDDQTLVESLFAIYFGNPRSGTLPAKAPLQIKILGLLSRSSLATSFTDRTIQLVEEGIINPDGQDTGPTIRAPTGREASKLRGGIFSFLSWVARSGSPADLRIIAPRLVYGIRDYVESQGWPVPGSDRATEPGLRGYAYELIGLLAGASPEDLLLDPNIDLVRWLFTSLGSESSGDNISVSVGEALGSVLQALARSINSEVEVALRALLLQHMKLNPGDESPAGLPYKVQRSTRFVAVRFAIRCLPYHDVVGRWISLIAVGGRLNERNEVIEEGKKGLSPYWYRMLNPAKGGSLLQSQTASGPRAQFPDFSDLVCYIFSGSESSMALEPSMDRLGVFAPSVVFSRRMLLVQAFRDTTIAVDVDANWERRLDVAVSSDETARAALRTFLKSLTTTGHERDLKATRMLLEAAFNGLVWNRGEGLDQCGDILVELCSVSGDAIIQKLATQTKRLHEAIFANKLRIRVAAAHAFGILGSHQAFTPDELKALFGVLFERVRTWKHAIGSDVNKVHGSILTLAYIFSRLHARGRSLESSELRWEDFSNHLLDILTTSKDGLLQDAATLGFEQLSVFGIVSPSHILTESTSKSMTDSLVKRAKAGNETSMFALGRFAMTCSEDDLILDGILKELYQLHDLRQAEVQFTVGEALTCAAVGWRSKSMMAYLDVEAAAPALAARENTLSNMVEKIIADCKQTKPALRRASCIWLLCIVEYCGHVAEVQTRLRVCQVAFKGFLSDRDELVQESASRGLTLVYEKGDKELKDDLVRDLVSSFTATNANLAGNVDEDTELFDPGALPTGDGSVSTYKDIMSLAAEVGDPSLVYRFMSMASSNAIWSSRAAFGRFGLGNILSESSVDGYLAQNPKLYPKLYRYRFDPNTKVQRSMNDIWTALVKDSGATIDKYFDDIMDDLLVSIIGKEWRVRQASCAAIADLVQGRPVEKYGRYLGQIWTMAFKVLDDIKESVRSSAMSLCRVLTGMLVRSVEAGSSSKQSNAMLDNVMPFLMSPSGLEASAQEVQAFALDTILRLAKTGTKALRPFLPSLVERLLGLLSTLEPEAVNYLHLNAAKYNLTEEGIDAARLKSVRGSPVMDAIERCLDILDDNSMKDLVPCLENAMRQAVGMPSKVGCSRILVSLSTRHNYIFRPYAATFLKAIEKAVRDRNDTVSSSYATATGYLARLVPDRQVVHIGEFSRGLYFDAEDDKSRLTAGEIVHATSKFAADRFSGFATEFLPFVFFAKHDSHDQVRQVFESTWDESVGGARTILLYLEEIVSLARAHLDSARWGMKHAAALSIADAADSVGGDMKLPQQELVWPALEQALAGKTWEGKEKVLEAFVKFAGQSSQLQNSDSGIAERMKKLILHESQRHNASYRQQALHCLGQFADGYELDDLSQVVLDLVDQAVDQVLADEEDNDRMDVDSGAGNAPSESIGQSTVANAVRAGFLSINPTMMANAGLLRARLAQVLSTAEKAKASRSAKVQAAICDGVVSLSRRLQSSDADFGPGKAADILTSLTLLISPLGLGASLERMKRAEAAEEIAQLLTAIGRKGRSASANAGAPAPAATALAGLQEQLLAARGTERDRSVQAILARTLANLP